MLRETVEIVKSMWSEPDTTYDGKYFQLQGAQCDPKPVQQPHPPIWIGGGGEQLTLRVVARHADRSNFGGKPHEFPHKCEVLKEHCKAVGRDYDEIAKTWSPEVFVRETEQEIVDARQPQFFGEPFDSWRRAISSVRPNRSAEKIRTYIDLGCSGFVPWCSDYPDTESMRLLAEKVIPELPLTRTRASLTIWRRHRFLARSREDRDMYEAFRRPNRIFRRIHDCRSTCLGLALKHNREVETAMRPSGDFGGVTRSSAVVVTRNACTQEEHTHEGNE